MSKLQYDITEYFGYLNRLRESGETNMFGAGRYLEAEFGVNRHQARDILIEWMKSFNKEDV
jgi:hypothetical protein